MLVKGERLQSNTFQIVSSALRLVKAKSPPPIFEVLFQKSAECERMEMVDQNLWSVDQSVPVGEPTVTEFAVLSSSAGEGGVKAADCVEALSRNREIVTGGKPCPLWVSVMPPEKVIDDYLASHRIPVATKGIDCLSAHGLI